MKNKPLHNNLLRQMKVFAEIKGVNHFKHFAMVCGIGGNYPEQSLRNKFIDDNKQLTKEQLEDIVTELGNQCATRMNMTEDDLKTEILKQFTAVSKVHEDVENVVNGDNVLDHREAKAVQKKVVHALAVLNELYLNLDQAIADG